VTSITAYNLFNDHIRELSGDALPLDTAHGDQNLRRGAVTVKSFGSHQIHLNGWTMLPVCISFMKT